MKRTPPRILSLAGAWCAVVLVAGGAADRCVADVVIGEINANEVYVRSGDSLNHYTVCKLSAGDPVRIVGARGEWYEILPPPGTFSLISGDYVDVADGRGVVSGQNVRVRAGSLLNENKYTVQLMLNKGAEVKVLGKNPDGFLRIEPPSGATLWVHRSFVSLDGAATVPASVAAGSGGASASSVTVEGTPAVETGSASRTSEGKSEVAERTPERHGVAAPAPSLPPDSPLAGVPATEHVRRLHTLEASLSVELTKAPFERNYSPLIQGYQSVADQTEDEVARRYAMGRLTQLTELTDLTGRAQRLRELDDETARRREEFLQARVSIPLPTPPDPAALDVQGELRESALYPAGSLPRRYRLVDPRASQVRTVAYVEVPAESGIRVEDFVGRYVGVRASARLALEGGIDPVPVYVAREIVVTSAASGSGTAVGAAPAFSYSPVVAPSSGVAASPAYSSPGSTATVILRDVR